VGVKESEENKEFRKSSKISVYPNPAKKLVLIVISNQKNSEIECRIYDTAGRLVKTLFNGTSPVEQLNLIWDAKDTNNENVEPGVYFAHIKTNSIQDYAKIVIIK